MERKLKLFLQAIGFLFCILIHSSKCAITTSQQQELLDAHNMYRRSVQPMASDMLHMVWNDELAQVAQMWADQCQIDPLQHNPDPALQSPSFNTVGENIGFTTNLNERLTETVRRWHDEVQHYTYGPVGGSNTCSSVCGHYTQVVWAKSEYLGCGISTNCNFRRSPALLLVCNYGPAGNFQGEEPYRRGVVCSNCPSGYSCQNQLCANSGNKIEEITDEPTTDGGTGQIIETTVTGSENVGITDSVSQTEGSDGGQTGGNQNGGDSGQMGKGSETGDGSQTGSGKKTGEESGGNTIEEARRRNFLSWLYFRLIFRRIFYYG